MTSNPEDRDTLYEKAHQLREEGDLGGAIDIMFELLSRNVQDRAVVRDLASLLAEDDQLDRAERVFQHALKITDQDPALAINYGAFLGQSGRLEESRKWLEQQLAAIAKLLSAAEQEDDTLADEHREGMAICTLNLARTLLEMGEGVQAWGHAEQYLVDPRHWAHADDIVYEAAKQMGEDFHDVCRRFHASRIASPLMVWQIVEAVAVDTHDVVAAARVLIKATNYLPGWQLMGAAAGEKVLLDLARSMGDELARRAKTNAAVRKVFKKYEELLDDLAEVAELPPPMRPELPGIPLLPEPPVQEPRTPGRHTPFWEGARKEQTTIQFGDGDLPLFGAAEKKTPSWSDRPIPPPVRPPAWGDEDFWIGNPRYMVQEDEWIDGLCELAIVIFEGMGKQGETEMGLCESGIPEQDADQVITQMLNKGEIEEMDEDEWWEDGETRYRIPLKEDV